MRESNKRKLPKLVRLPDGTLASDESTSEGDELKNDTKKVIKSGVNEHHADKSLSNILGMSDDGTPLDENGNPIVKEKRFDWEESKDLAKEYFAKAKKRQKATLLELKKKIKSRKKTKDVASPMALSKNGKIQRTDPGVKRIELALTLPDTKKIKDRSLKKLSKLTKKQKRIGIVAVSLLVVLCGFKVLTVNKKGQSSNEQGVLGSNNSKIPINVTPEFAVLKPNNKRIEDLGGFARTSPQGAAAAYTYIDTIGGTRVKLTQQQLPQAFKEKPVTELEKLAKNFNASKLIQIDDIAAYIGKSEKGPQTLIFTKDDLLVFAVADNELEEVQWVQYVSGLKK